MYAVAFNCSEFLNQIECTNGETGTDFVERRKNNLKKHCKQIMLVSRLNSGKSRNVEKGSSPKSEENSKLYHTMI